MKCEQFEDDALLFVLGALDPAEMSAWQRHLQHGCQTCSKRLAEAEAASAQLSLALGDEPMPTGIQDRLVDGLSQRPTIAQTSASLQPRLGWFTLGTVAAGVMVALSLGGYVGYAAVSGALNQKSMVIAGLKQKLSDRDAVLADFGGTLQQVADLYETHLQRDTVVIALSATEAAPDGAWGRIVWNEPLRRWHLFGAANAKTSGVWQLWSASDGGPTSRCLATFPAGKEGALAAQGEGMEIQGELFLTWATAESDSPDSPSILRGTVSKRLANSSPSIGQYAIAF